MKKEQGSSFWFSWGRPLDTIIKILGYELLFRQINIDKCYVCGQNHPYCCQAMQVVMHAYGGRNQSGAEKDNRLFFSRAIDSIVFEIQDGVFKNRTNQESN